MIDMLEADWSSAEEDCTMREDLDLTSTRSPTSKRNVHLPVVFLFEPEVAYFIQPNLLPLPDFGKKKKKNPPIHKCERAATAAFVELQNVQFPKVQPPSPDLDE